MTKKPLVWMDLEMSGLDRRQDVILEIATIVTDSDLNVVANGPELVIHHPDSILDGMDEWNTEHHGASGLTQRVRESTISTADAERQTLEFLKEHMGPRVAPLCGNSIWQDRRFLDEHMRELEEFLHYRIIDVSSIKEVVARWYPQSARPPRKKEAHRALDDIVESIEELRWYRKKVFVGANPPKDTAQ